MDPFSLNLLGQIRQQELLEQAAKGKHDMRRWLWRLSTFQFDVWQENDDAARTPPYLSDGRPRFQGLRALAAILLPRLSRRARQFVPLDGSATSQVLTDPQCASEC